MTSTFWTSDPNILLKKEVILQIWPTTSMSYEEKLNAISRLVILLTLLGFLVTMSKNMIYIGVVTLAIIIIMYFTQKQKLTKAHLNLGSGSTEGFVGGAQTITPDTLQPFLKSDFVPTTKKNPLGNVLLTDIGDNPTRKAAAPAFNTEVYEDINNATKKMVQSLNPGIKNTNKQLYGDLGEQFEFDQSQWSYYSTPNTKIPNDQGAFANFLYGDMPSCRDGNAFACIQDNIRYNLY